MQARMGEALDGIDVILGHQLARAPVREVGQRLDARQARRRLGKRGMRLIADAGAQPDQVIRIGDLRRVGVVRQRLSLVIDIPRLRHLDRRCGDHLVGALQIVVLQRRFVDLRGKGDLVLAVRLHGIEMLGTVGKCRVENVASAVGRRVGIVPGTAAAEQRPRRGQHHDNQQFGHAGQCIRSAIIRAAQTPGEKRWAFSPASAFSSPGCCPTVPSPTASPRLVIAKAPASHSLTRTIASRSASPSSPTNWVAS